MGDIENTEHPEDFLYDMNHSLAEQVKIQMDTEEVSVEDIAENQVEAKKKKKFPLWLKVSSIVFTVTLMIGIGALTYVNYLFNQMNYDDGSQVEQKNEFFEQDEGANDLDDEVNPDDVVWDDGSDLIRKEDGIINILLVGEEAIGDGSSRGRTDSIMIATVNTKQKSLKLTSIMRDTYVQIPGYSDNKVNAAYHNGGMPLLMETLERNFDLEVDGYVLVNFNSFEQVIDKLGGVEITLSGTEASYLNRTNYISNPSNRNVYAGTQMLNGNQALGYSRVRYVPNGDQSDDFGRTSRQRKVLNALFEKYKSKNEWELIAMLPELLSMVTTDINKSQFIEYISTVVTLGVTELETFRIPVDGAFKITRIRGMSVLLPQDLKTNTEEMQKFIFGEDVEQVNNPNSETLGDTAIQGNN